MKDMKQVDDECFAAAETLVASVFAGASHRERIALVLDIATPIFAAVKAAIAKQGKAASSLTAPAAPRKRRTKAELEAARGKPAAEQPSAHPTTPPAPRPAAPAPPIPPPSGLAPSPFGAPLNQ